MAQVDTQTEANRFIMRGCPGMTDLEKEKRSTECTAKERANVSENAQINLNILQELCHGK